MHNRHRCRQQCISAVHLWADWPKDILKPGVIRAYGDLLFIMHFAFCHFSGLDANPIIWFLLCFRVACCLDLSAPSHIVVTTLDCFCLRSCLTKSSHMGPYSVPEPSLLHSTGCILNQVQGLALCESLEIGRWPSEKLGSPITRICLCLLSLNKMPTDWCAG